ncbi:MAG: hypothetical protein AAF337_10985 [Pseudomonadota bacterium]
MVILDDVADGYLLECNCGTRLSCRHEHGVVECPKCGMMHDPKSLMRSPEPARAVSQCAYMH